MEAVAEDTGPAQAGNKYPLNSGVRHTHSENCGDLGFPFPMGIKRTLFWNDSKLLAWEATSLFNPHRHSWSLFVTEETARDRAFSKGGPLLWISMDQERKAPRQESKAYPLSQAYGDQWTWSEQLVANKVSAGWLRFDFSSLVWWLSICRLRW